MNAFMDKFSMFAAKFGNEIHLRSLRDAFVTIMPLYILAGIAVLLNNTVFPWVLSGDVLSTVQYWGTVLINGTLNVSGLLVAAMIGYSLASNRQYKNPIAAALIAVATLVVMMPNTVSVTPDGAEAAVAVSGILPFSNLGTGAMFAGIIIGLSATELFIALSNVKAFNINLGDNVPPAVGNSFSVLIPVVLTMSIFAIISTALMAVTGMNVINLITTFIQEPLRSVGCSLWGCIILYALGNLLWLFGIHQSVIYSSILEPLLIININENIAAALAGEAIPNIINVSQVTGFGLLGGSGSTICLIIATLLFGRNKVTKNLSKMALGPGIFNINEPVIFGYPIVYNITMAIPFVLVPTLGILISYIATSIGFMNPCISMVPWTTPVLVSGFLATGGDFRAVIVQALVLVIGVLVYAPFVKINDRVLEKQAEMENAD